MRNEPPRASVQIVTFVQARAEARKVLHVEGQSGVGNDDLCKPAARAPFPRRSDDGAGSWEAHPGCSVTKNTAVDIRRQEVDLAKTNRSRRG